MVSASIEILVKKVKTQDVQEWTRLRHKLWPGTKQSHASEVRALVGKPGFVAFIAWQGHQPIGFSEAMVRPFANGCRERPVAFLEGLWVDSNFRQKGVGRKLVNAVEDWAIKKGFRELGSDAYLHASASHRAHLAYGFKEMERVVYFRKSLSK